MLGMSAVATVLGVGSNGGGTVGKGVVVVLEVGGHDGKTRMRDLNLRKLITLE